MKNHSKTFQYRGATIRVFPYADDQGWNAVTDYGNGIENDCYLTSASNAEEAYEHAKEIVDREIEA